MREPLISIILPVYNIEQYLPKCMESLFGQTYKNLEFVLVDDGSEIACKNLCDEYAKQDSRVVVYHKANGGLSDARNYGIKRARGEYISCVDPDDYVDTDYVEYLYSLLSAFECQMSICQLRVKYDNGMIKDKGTDRKEEKVDTVFCLEEMLYHGVVDTCAYAKLYHRSLFDHVRYPKGKIFEDIGTTYELIMQCDNIALGYQSKYTYAFHNNSIVNSRFNQNKFDLLEMTDKMAQDVSEKYSILQKAVLRRQVYARISTLNQMLNVPGYDIERNEILQYIRRYSKNILEDPKAPKRDKVAVILLRTNYKVYKFCWNLYRNYIMRGDN